MPITEKNLLPLLAVALVGGVSTFFGSCETPKKCDKQCKKASNFKSQLGEKVEENPAWKVAALFFETNELLIKSRALEINQSISDVSGSVLYEPAAALLQSLVVSSLIPGLRILVAQPDGHVTFDSAAGANNTFANAVANTINPENHNTRPAIMSAQLSCDGNGNEIKSSLTTLQLEAYNARRILPFYGANGGTVRVSKTIDIPVPV